MSALRERFRALHASGFFVMPNPWDVGSAVLLERMGFSALATTSSGHAQAMGTDDHRVSFEEVCRHVASLVDAMSIPLSIDGGRLFAETPDGIAARVATLGQLGAAGISIEDYDPVTGTIDPVPVSVTRVEAAVEAARDSGLVLTARADNHLCGVDDFEDTLRRLVAYRAAGADVVYAPGVDDPGPIRRIVDETGAAVNVLLTADGPKPGQLAALGVRRASTGGSLALAAYRTAEVAAGLLRA